MSSGKWRQFCLGLNVLIVLGEINSLTPELSGTHFERKIFELTFRNLTVECTPPSFNLNPSIDK